MRGRELPFKDSKPLVPETLTKLQQPILNPICNYSLRMLHILLECFSSARHGSDVCDPGRRRAEPQQAPSQPGLQCETLSQKQ